jgi:hypothetical protein
MTTRSKPRPAITFRPSPDNWIKIRDLKTRGLKVEYLMNQALAEFMPKMLQAAAGLPKETSR